MGLFKKQHAQVRQARITEDNDAYAFRRSRTMTGSLSNNVRAAAETHADLQSGRLKHHMLRKKRRFLFVYFLVTVGVIGLMTMLLNQSMLSVRLLALVGAPSAPTTSYAQSIDTYLSTHPNERFSFSLRSDALTSSLQQQFPEVLSVQVVAQPWLQAAKATITLRHPIASWTLGTTKYYIDDHGIAFLHNYLSEPTLIVEDKTGIDPATGGTVASERMVHYIGRLVALLSKAGYTVEKLELPAGTSREVDVRLVGKAYVLKISLDRDPAGQVADIVSAVNYFTVKAVSPTYADVRVSSKLYYK